jgi:hypothetical protein
MSAIEKINNSGLNTEEKEILKASIVGLNNEIKNQIIQNNQVTDTLLRKYIQGKICLFDFTILLKNFLLDTGSNGGGERNLGSLTYLLSVSDVIYYLSSFFFSAADFFGKNEFLARLGLSTPIDQLGFYGSISVFVGGSFVSLRSAHFLSKYIHSQATGDVDGAQRWAARGKFPSNVLQEAPKYLSEYKARPRLWAMIPVGFLAFEIIKSGFAGAYRAVRMSKVSKD